MLTSERTKLITNVTEQITAYFDTDDNRLDKDYIWEQALLTRAILIKRLLGKSDRLPSGFYSRIELDVTDATIADPDLSGYKRSAIPKLMDVKDRIRFLGPQDMSAQYQEVSYDGFFSLSDGREWTGSNVFFTVFSDNIFYSTAPLDSEDDEYSELAAWVLLENIEDDPNFDEDNNRLVPMDYQLMLEEMISERILKYADKGLLNKENNATDFDAV